MRDMTAGPAYSHLWRYALPLLLGNAMQLAYNAADAMIAGRFIGRDALAAEGIAGPVMNLVILAVSGFCIGAGILMSEAFGAKENSRLRRVLAVTLRFGVLLSAAVAAFGVLLTPAVLRLLSVPADIFRITGIYFRITLLGAPFTFFFSALSSALKSVGDSKTPLKFLAFSSILNIVLDLIFLGLLGFGIVCSAVTTVAAEAASAVLAGVYMRRRFPELWPRGTDWHADRPLLRKIIRYAAPTALQQAIQPIGKVLIQGQINLLGVNAIAAFNAVTRVDDFACIPEQGISAAISTFIAQNRGAGKPERIRPGFRVGLRMEAGYWVLIGCTVALLRRPVVSLFVAGDGAAEIIALGAQYLAWMSAFYLLPAMTNGFQGFYRGMGRMLMTILGTLTQISIRAAVTALLAPSAGITGVAFACAAGWSCMLLIEVPWYFRTCRQLKLPRSEGT